MRIDGVRSYSVYSRVNQQNKTQRNHQQAFSTATNENNVAFKASVGKIAGFILGAAAVAVAAPGVAMVGLAGIGALPGMMLGHAIDEKIEEHQNKKK